MPLTLQPKSARELLGGGSSGGHCFSMAMGAPIATPQPASPLAVPTPLAFNERVIQPAIVFPTAGRYVAFVNFRPKGGDEVRLTVPITVGATGRLTSGIALTQSVGGLLFELTTGGPLLASQPATLTLAVTDDAGLTRTPDIEVQSGAYLNLYAIDAALTTFLVADIVEPSNLEFSMTFPQPGRYKVWLNFRNPDQQQAAFIVDVQ